MLYAAVLCIGKNDLENARENHIPSIRTVSQNRKFSPLHPSKLILLKVTNDKP